MNILIDAGNSRIKWAIDADDLWATGVSKRADFADALKKQVDENNTDVDGVFISSTRNQNYNLQLTVMLEDLFNKTAVFVEPQRRLHGVINRYEPVLSLGSDRWAAIIAARSLSNSPAIVIDCGTAVTVDAVNSEGMFEGGVIFPGIDLALQSLNSADNLNLAKEAEANVFGLNTDQAMYSGVLYSIAWGIDGIVQQMRKSLGYSVNVYLCGGDMGKFIHLLEHHVIQEPELVLKGLKIIADGLP